MAISDIVELLRADPEKLRRMNEEMADIEFMMDIAPRIGYKGPIDPKAARFHGLGGEPGSPPTRGFTVPADASFETGYDMRPYKIRGEKDLYVVEKEPNTVNAIGVDNARPELWSHEYRHMMHPEMSERQNRIADAANAQNEREWKDVVKLWADQLTRDSVSGKKYTPSEAEENLVWWLGWNNDSAARGAYEDQFRRGAIAPGEASWYSTPEHHYEDWKLENPYWKRRKKELLDQKIWNEGLPKRNEKRLKQLAKKLRESRT